MGQFRPPRTLPGFTPEQCAAIFAELDRVKNDLSKLEGTAGPQRIYTDGLVSGVTGDVMRFSPGPNGQKLLLPASNLAGKGAFVDVLFNGTRGGTLTVGASPQTKPPGFRFGTVNDEKRFLVTESGWYRFEADGQNGWYTVPGGGSGATGPTGSTGPTGPTGATGTFVAATGSEDGYASFTEYLFADNGLQWTTVGDIPDGSEFWFILRGPGGGGASGSCNCSVGASQSMSNNAAGGQGAEMRRRFSRAQLVDLIGNGAITFNLSDGGAGGAQTQRVASSGSTIGNGGNAATDDATITAVDSNGRTFVLMSAGRGGGGRAHAAITNQDAGGGGGGTLGAATGGPTSGSTSNGGQPNPNTGAVAGNGDAGAGASNSADGLPAGPGGGASGAPGSQATANALAGGRNSNGGGGGGAGGGCSATTPRNGGDGGGRGTSIGTSGGGGVATSAGSGTISPGAAGLGGDECSAGEGGGGGGCARGTGADQTGGAGGAGGKGGGGGGGGGGAVADTTHTATGGAGGKGGESQCLIIGTPGA